MEIKDTSLWVVLSLEPENHSVPFPLFTQQGGFISWCICRPWLLCLGFQHHRGFSVCEISYPWNESWKPDINEPRPCLGREWRSLFYFGIFFLGLSAFLAAV